jgi:release factor glutamine methyltransferase
MIVSNPPYIGHEERGKMSPSTLTYEPSVALFPPDDDPLVFYRRISGFAKHHLSAGGCICLEMNEFRAKEIRAIYQAAGFGSVEIIRDIQGKDRILVARKG